MYFFFPNPSTSGLDLGFALKLAIAKVRFCSPDADVSSLPLVSWDLMEDETFDNPCIWKHWQFRPRRTKVEPGGL